MDSQAKQLIQVLKAEEHDVLTIKNMVGAADSAVMAFAQQQKRVLCTRNCSDFYELHQNTPGHFGVLIVYQEADSRKNKSYQAIVNAISKLEALDLSLVGQIIVLNQ